MASIFTVANQKGGVGKTTTCASLGAALAEHGKRVLLIDLDPQAGLSIALGYAPTDFTRTVYHALVEEEPLKNIVFATKFPGLDLAPSNLDLAGAEAELIGEIGWDRSLKDALEPVLPAYDYVLLDCPPTLGILTTNAMVAGHLVIVPIECEYLALQALKQLHTIVAKIRRKANPDLKLKVLRTKVDLRTTLGREVFEEIGRAGGDQVFQDIFIKKTIKFAESTAAGEPILLYATDSEVAQAYRNLAEELLRV